MIPNNQAVKLYSEAIVNEENYYSIKRNRWRHIVALFYCDRNYIIEARIEKLLKSTDSNQWNNLSEAGRIKYAYRRAAVERAVQRMLRLKN